MAEFNPQFNTPDAPLYLKLSQAGNAPQPIAPVGNTVVDKSKEYSLQGLSTAIEGGTAAADTAIKSVIRNNLEDKINARRDQFNNQLDDLLGGNKPNPSNPLDANASMDLMPDSTTAPSGVTNAISAVSKLQASKDQNGKFRTTSMDADILRILKQARADFPGYRDYIDQQGSSIVGYNVANKLVSDKIAQLNEIASQTRSERDKVDTFIKQHSNVTGFANMMSNWKAGTVTENDVYRWAGAADQAKYNLDMKKLNWEAAQADKNLSQSKGAEYGEGVVDHFVNDSYRNSRLTIGQDPTKTGQEIQDYLTSVAADPSKYPGDEQMEMLRNTYEGLRVDATSKIHALIFTPNPKTGRSVADDWGVDNANAFITKSVDAAFGTTSKFFSKKDFALAESNARRVASVGSDANMKLLNSDMGEEAALSKAVANDPALSAVVSQKILTQPGFVGKLNNFVESKVMRGSTQFDLGKKGTPATISKDISDTQNTNGTPSEKAVAVQTFGDVYKVITDNKTSDKAKLAAAKYLFDQSNAGFLQKITPEGIGADGQPTKGQIDLFEQVTNPKLSEEMWKLSQRTGDKSVWNNYTRLTQHEFGTKMVTDIQNLNNLQDKSSLYGAQWHFAYDPEAKQFYPLHEDGTYLSTAEQTWLNPAYRTIDAINRGLENIKHMAEVSKASPDSVDAYIFQTLEQAGWSPTKAVNGVPARLMNAILIAKGQPPEAKDEPKAPKVPMSQ